MESETMPFSRPFPKNVLMTVVASAIPALLVFGIPYFAGQYHISFFLSPLGLLSALVILIGLGALSGCLVSLLFRKIRIVSFLILLSCLTILGCASFWNFLAQNSTRSDFHVFIVRSKPLIAAIGAYERKNGKPPAKLNDIVPQFLPAIPSTGLKTKASYQYYAGINVGRPDEDQPWVLKVSVSDAKFIASMLVYHPDHQYSSDGTLRVERIGDWALVTYI